MQLPPKELCLSPQKRICLINAKCWKNYGPYGVSFHFLSLLVVHILVTMTPWLCLPEIFAPLTYHILCKHFQINLKSRRNSGSGKATFQSMSASDIRSRRPVSAVPAFRHQVQHKAVTEVAHHYHNSRYYRELKLYDSLLGCAWSRWNRRWWKEAATICW